MCVIQSIIVHVQCTKIWRKKALMIILKHLKMPTCRQTICHMFIGVHLWYHHDLYPFCSEYTAFSRDFFLFSYIFYVLVCCNSYRFVYEKVSDKSPSLWMVPCMEPNWLKRKTQIFNLLKNSLQRKREPCGIVI